MGDNGKWKNYFSQFRLLLVGKFGHLLRIMKHYEHQLAGKRSLVYRAVSPVPSVVLYSLGLSSCVWPSVRDDEFSLYAEGQFVSSVVALLCDLKFNLSQTR